MALLTAIKTLLYRKSGQEDIVVGSPFAGRVRPELEGQVGPYLNVLPLRDTIRGGDRFDALLARVRQTTLEAFANQLYPVDWLLGELGVKRVAGRNPLYDASFTLHNQRRLHAGSLRLIELPSLDLQPINPDAMTRFWFVADPRPEGEIAMSIVYDGSLSSETSVRRMAEDLKSIVVQAIADPGVRVQSLQLGGGASARPVAAKVAIDLSIH
jgi:non-ribosomal peptide synthetase component F